MKSLQRALMFLRPYWLITLGAFLSLLLVTAANLAGPQILRVVIDSGIRDGNQAALLWATGALIGVAAARGLFSFTQGFWSEKASQSAAYEMRDALFAKLGNLSFSYHDQAQTGQLMTRITSDVEQVRSFIGAGLLQVVSAIALLLGSLVALFSTNWRLASITLLTIPVMMAVLVRFMRLLQPLFGQLQKKLGALNTVLQENLVGVRVVQAFAREEYEIQRYTALNDQLLDTNLLAVRGMASAFPLIFLISNLGTLAVSDAEGRLSSAIVEILRSIVETNPSSSERLAVGVAIEPVRVRLHFDCGLHSHTLELIRPLIDPLGGEVETTALETKLWLPRA